MAIIAACGLVQIQAQTPSANKKPAEPAGEPQRTQLLEPYAPKPSGNAPEGWEIKPLKGSSIETVTRLQNGKEIKVNAIAYQLVPKDGGVVLKDPRFDPRLANSQTATIGAVITNYSEKVTSLQKELDETIAALDEALSKTPTAKPAPAPTPAANPTSKKR